MNNTWRFLKEALESLNANKMRTGLTMLGIVIGVAAVVSMLAIGTGAESSITSSIEGMGTNVLFIKVDNDVTNPEPLTMADAEAIMESEGTPSVLAVAPTVSVNKDLSFSGNSTSSSITGLTPDYALVRNEVVEVGRFISDEDVNKHATVAVIGADIVDVPPPWKKKPSSAVNAPKCNKRNFIFILLSLFLIVNSNRVSTLFYSDKILSFLTI